MNDDILFLLVTCSLDESRARVLNHVVDNLNQQNEKWAFLQDMLVFDNASKFQDPLKRLAGAKVLEASENIGYWSAIWWVLNHYQEVCQREYSYIYIIESDLLHYDMHRLQAACQFLSCNQDVGYVRTQEFIVAEKELYDKTRPLPESRRHAWVKQLNYVTRERNWFELADEKNGIFKTNFHGHLPALHRLDVLKRVFDDLKEMDAFGEQDFFEAYYNQYRVNSVLDGGIYHGEMGCNGSDIVTGSHTRDEILDDIGYQATTRNARIQVSGYNMKVW